tara:strand:- start:319 stop:1281 length:963 start_codon:yes stop_codon:yes gene_type:complete
MILITGGTGFIGSNLVNSLDKSYNIYVSDWMKPNIYLQNFDRKKIINPEKLINFININKNKISSIIHLGAITSTTEKDVNLILKNNVILSEYLWNFCCINKKKFIYASSAATYGNGMNGFDDDQNHGYYTKLEPLNIYGWSKHIFDRFVLKSIEQGRKPLQWVGLKFFNVYGPHEFHKGEMRSIVCKIYERVIREKSINLFKSHRKDYLDGEQLRDFIYVEDVIDIIIWLLKKEKINGIFNIGTGEPKSFKDIASLVFKFCNKEKKITYIDMPKNIRSQYQYFTKANVKKLRKHGYKRKFTSLEKGIKSYINNYLLKKYI